MNEAMIKRRGKE